jgi:hypothetical protein
MPAFSGGSLGFRFFPQTPIRPEMLIFAPVKKAE